MYMGGITHLTVTLDSGQQVRSMISEHWDEEEAKIAIGDKVEISFEQRAAVLLEE
jgi:translation initiation factor IF-1